MIKNKLIFKLPKMLYSKKYIISNFPLSVGDDIIIRGRGGVGEKMICDDMGEGRGPKSRKK